MGKLGITKGDYPPPLPAGRYKAILSEVKEGQGKKYMSEEMEQKIFFIFKILETGEDRETRYQCKPTNSPKGNLVKFASKLHPTGNLKDETKKDPEKLEAYLIKLVGQEYVLQLGVSQDGKWNNIDAVLPKGTPTLSVNDDEIPF